MSINSDCAAPEISVAIVSFNTCDLLRACLQALQARHDAGEAILEIIVADNGSKDGSCEMVRCEFPQVHLIETGGNIGYGRANNMALQYARGRFFFVLNSDTQVQPGTLVILRDFMDAHPSVGATGAQLVLPDSTIQPSCARDPHLLPVFWEQTHFDRLLPRNRITGAYLMTDWDYQEVRQVEQVCGACLFVRREAWQQIGGFDPAFWMYFEDTDLCVRLRRAGWSIFFVPQARVLHFLGASSGDVNSRARMVASYNQSRYYFFHRNGGAWQGALLKTFVLMGATLRLFTWHLHALRRHGEPQRDARDKVRLFRSVLRRTWRMTHSPYDTAR